MKKLISAILAGAAVCTSVASFSANADDEYLPRLYFKGIEAEGVTVDTDGNITIDRSVFSKAGYEFSANLFVEDEKLCCRSVAPKVKCADKNLKLLRLHDPWATTGDEPYTEFAYAETDENGNFQYKRIDTMLSTSEEYNTLNFTCRADVRVDDSPMKPYGEKSDSYPLVRFDMSLDRNTPCGEYTVYIITEPGEYVDDQTSRVQMIEDGIPVVSVPTYTPLKVTVTGANPGDINNDGKIDSKDASLALAAYSKSSVGKEHGLTDVQFTAGDIDSNGILDSNDATKILRYYGYVSTSDGELTLTEFLAKN